MVARVQPAMVGMAQRREGATLDAASAHAPFVYAAHTLYPFDASRGSVLLSFNLAHRIVS
jgi:hypothetical protein